MPKKNTIRNILIIAPVIVAIASFLFIAKLFYTPYQGTDMQFNIKRGEGFSKVNYRLNKLEVLSSPRIFHYYAKLSSKMNKLKAGTYLIPSGANMGSVLSILTEGVPILTKVTIPEGKNMYEIAKILEQHKITSADKFLKVCTDPLVIKRLGIDAPSVEGYLFPDTYKFAPNSQATEVVSAMLSLFKKKIKILDIDDSDLSPHEVIILASIVEKETGAKKERPTIAGVYLNRLKIRMRLQADPTTIYGIWKTYKGNLRKKHLLQKTAYNTYKMSGLPLGPIANPSLAAIKAVLAPKEHDYIYFVSKNDGTHVFTPTYKKHLKAVKYWQQNRKRRQGKSWRDLKED